MTILLTILGIHLLALISPGPDFVMAVKNSLQYSRKTGIWTAVGFGGGITVHIAYCLAGVALIISKSIIVFSVLKYLGAAYLIYLGIGALLARKPQPSEHEMVGYAKTNKSLARHKALRQGFLTNVLNPKATLFFLGLFTLIITPSTPNRVLIAASIGMIINTILWFSCVAIFFTNTKIHAWFRRSEYRINKSLGAALVLLGAKVATASLE